jgi:YcaO-like protein with predicted kinase domain
LGYERMKRMNQLWFGPAERRIGLKKLPDLATSDITEDILALKRNLAQVGMTRIIVHDLTRPEIDVPVVRVIVPGMEVFAIDPDRVGRRLMEASRR